MRSKTLESKTLTVLSCDGSTLPAQVTVTVPIQGGVNNDLIRALSTACSLGDDETLLVARIYSNRLIYFLNELNDSLLVEDSRAYVAYRLLKDEDSWPLVVFTHRSYKDLSYKCHDRFGIPMVAKIHPNRCNSVEIRQKFLKLLKPFRVGEATCVNERFEFLMTPERISSKVTTKIAMNDELLVVPSSGEIYVFVTWPDEMLKHFDTEILNHLPTAGELPESVVSLYQCLDDFSKEKEKEIEIIESEIYFEEMVKSMLEGKEIVERKKSSIEVDDTDFELDEWFLQSVKHQKHILKILEKCMKREIYLEKMVSELTRVEETQLTHVLEKLYEAENASVVLMEIFKELSYERKMLQFNLNRAVHLGAEYEDEIQKLEGFLTEAECWVDKYHNKCWELRDECEKVNSVEKELNDVKVKLQQAEACNEDIKDENNMLRSTIEDMKKKDMVKRLETTLHRMEEANKASTKETSLCCKLLTYVVMHQMLLERERQL